MLLSVYPLALCFPTAYYVWTHYKLSQWELDATDGQWVEVKDAAQLFGVQDGPHQETSSPKYHYCHGTENMSHPSVTTENFRCDY